MSLSRWRSSTHALRSNSSNGLPNILSLERISFCSFVVVFPRAKHHRIVQSNPLDSIQPFLNVDSSFYECQLYRSPLCNNRSPLSILEWLWQMAEAHGRNFFFVWNLNGAKHSSWIFLSLPLWQSTQHWIAYSIHTWVEFDFRYRSEWNAIAQCYFIKYYQFCHVS